MFETNAGPSESTEYTTKRRMYLVSKISDLSRKQKAIAFRQDQQLASVSDRVEVEKRHMMMQLFDLEQEEVCARTSC